MFNTGTHKARTFCSCAKGGPVFPCCVCWKNCDWGWARLHWLFISSPCHLSPLLPQDCIQLNQYKLKSEIGKVSEVLAISLCSILTGLAKWQQKVDPTLTSSVKWEKNILLSLTGCLDTEALCLLVWWEETVKFLTATIQAKGPFTT